MGEYRRVSIPRTLLCVHVLLITYLTLTFVTVFRERTHEVNTPALRSGPSQSRGANYSGGISRDEPYVYSTFKKDRRLIYSRYRFRLKYLGLLEGSRWKIGKQWVSVKDWYMSDYIQPTMNEARGSVLAMGVTKDTFDESMAAVASAQVFFRRKRVLFYNWGLLRKQITQAKKWCNVKVMAVNFTRYPLQCALNNGGKMPSFRTAKVLTIIHALKRYRSVLWLDTAMRFNSTYLERVYRRAIQNQGLVFFTALSAQTKYTIPGYDVSDSSALLIMRTEYACENDLWWWYLCTLVEGCVVPSYVTMCEHPDVDEGAAVSDSPGASYQDCRSLNQSILSELGGNMYKFFVRRYGSRYRMMVRVVVEGQHDDNRTLVTSTCH